MKRGTRRRYEDFLRAYAHGELVLLEMGVGFSTTTIIRFPFEEITLANQHALLVRMNSETVPPRLPIRSRTVNIDAPLPWAVGQLLKEKKKAVQP